MVVLLVFDECRCSGRIGWAAPAGRRGRAKSKAVSARPSSDITSTGQPKTSDRDIDAAEQ